MCSAIRYWGFGLAILAASASCHEEEVTVYGRQINLVGEAVSASQGVVDQLELGVRPILRSGEVLEAVPGMVATQHSGTGKANQYFLRGFNLDHGTDFATFYDHMPVNMRTHGHGQGYTDLNSIIPELVQQIEYQKGTYYAEVGDFSSAGSAHLRSFSKLDKGLLQAGIGEDQFYRLLVMDSINAGGGELLYALEGNRYQGPWRDIDEDLDKINLTLKQSWRFGDDSQLKLMLMSYDNRWNSADQIPERAVAGGVVHELGSLDTTLGGESSRHSFSVNWQAPQWQLSAYAINYDMKLWSNFTYLLDDSVNGDQFEQVDKRWLYGIDASYRVKGTWGGKAVTNTFGMETRYDDIDEVGLYRTRAQQRLGTVRSDGVEEFSVGLYWQSELQLGKKLRTIFGVRYDYYDFDVDSHVATNIHGVDLTSNGGGEADDLLTAKASVSYTLNDRWEFYGSAGQGFHSNDGRGTTIAVDPISGGAVNAVDPLVKSRGLELGVRSFWGRRLNASLALWSLTLDSELLFVGDAGGTEATRESERKGVEFTSYYRFNKHWTLDLEYAYTDAEFSEANLTDPQTGKEIPGALDTVFSLGLSVQYDKAWFGSLRLRHFGERPLAESGNITADASTIVNLRLGYRWQKLKLTLDLLNLLDSDDHDIDYLYESRLPSEPAAVADVHYRVMEPRTLRAYVTFAF